MGLHLLVDNGERGRESVRKERLMWGWDNGGGEEKSHNSAEDHSIRTPCPLLFVYKIQLHMFKFYTIH